MRIYLAPMEGVIDAHFRHLLTQLGGLDICVTEFVRVTHHLLPKRIFHKFCPELSSQSTTQAGTPVRIQLLGSDPDTLAVNAARAAELGASAIDLNFGCPAKTVNRHRGGACLLQEPHIVHDIVKAVRTAVDPSTPVTAKIRLGYNDRDTYLDNSLAIAEAGANELAVHARSKVDGYKPPAYWEYVARINESVNIPVIPNGEVWSVNDYLRCRGVTGIEDVMIGRGIISCPDLAMQIKAHVNQSLYQPMIWPDICQLLLQFLNNQACDLERYVTSRLKQWVVYLRRQYPEATACFERIKREQYTLPIKALIEHSREAYRLSA